MLTYAPNLVNSFLLLNSKEKQVGARRLWKGVRFAFDEEEVSSPENGSITFELALRVAILDAFRHGAEFR